MKIACISTSSIPSDTANSIQVMKACHALAQAGEQVHLLIPGNGAHGWNELAERYGLSTPIEISWLPAHPRLKRNDFAWNAVRRARKLDADLIYTWTGQSAVFGLLHGFPVAFEVHDLPTGHVGPLWYRLFQKLPGTKRLLPITQALRAALERAGLRFPDEQVVIVPNGVDLSQYQSLPDAPEARRRLGLPQAITALCAGHLYAGRGVDLFLGLAERFPQASFVWVGGRPEDVIAARQNAERAGLRNVTFTGFISNRRLPEYQAAADVLLMPYARHIAGSSGGNSADICSPMKMFDYLAASRAILSADLPVIHEVLDESNAVFAPPEDLQGWSQALACLLEDEVLRQNLAQQARQTAEKFSWRARAQKVLDSLK